MPAQELERLASLLHERSFPAGAGVLTAEQPGEAVYVLLSGSVKVHLFTPDGAEVILAVLGPGEVVGEMSLADSLGRSASVTTLEESVFLWIDRTTFRTGIEGSPVLARNLADILSRRVRVNQALGYLRKRAEISAGEDGRITVHDQQALARRAR
jgi:CRP/FNR family cyclic AMP-dependent transcriptional regulator